MTEITWLKSMGALEIKGLKEAKNPIAEKQPDTIAGEMKTHRFLARPNLLKRRDMKKALNHEWLQGLNSYL